MKTYEHQASGTVSRARQLRRDSTDPERVLWCAVRLAFPDRKWRRQMPVGPYFADLACFAERLIIEADGGQHAEASGDAARTRFLESQGYRVLRFWNNAITENVEGAVETIAQHLSPSPFRRCAPLSLSHWERDERRSRERVRVTTSVKEL